MERVSHCSGLIITFLFLCFPFFCRAVRLKGYQQQDSQELLRYLLDGMRAEEHQVSMFYNLLSLTLLSFSILRGIRAVEVVTEAIGSARLFLHQPFRSGCHDALCCVTFQHHVIRGSVATPVSSSSHTAPHSGSE